MRKACSVDGVSVVNIGGEVGVVSVTAREVHSVVIAVNEIKVVTEVQAMK